LQRNKSKNNQKIIWKKKTLNNSCGHTFCAKCAEEWNKENGNTCPVDNEPLGTLMPNKIVAKIVNKLKVACTSRYYGCKWEGGNFFKKKNKTKQNKAKQ